MNSIKITKIENIKTIKNDTCYNFYYICNGKFYNINDKKFKLFKFIICHDIFDVLEFYELDEVTNKQLKKYALELAYNFILNYANNFETLLKHCNKTLKNNNY